MAYSKYNSLIIPVPQNENKLTDILNNVVPDRHELISVGGFVVTDEQGRQEQKLIITMGKIKSP